MFLNKSTCLYNQNDTLCIQIGPWTQKVTTNRTFNSKVHDNKLVMNKWDYDDFITIGPFVGLVLINDMSFSHWFILQIIMHFSTLDYYMDNIRLNHLNKYLMLIPYFVDLNFNGKLLIYECWIEGFHEFMVK